MMLPDTDRDGTHRAAERLRRCISAAPFTVGAETVELTASVGWAGWLGEDPASSSSASTAGSARRAKPAATPSARAGPGRTAPGPSQRRDDPVVAETGVLAHARDVRARAGGEEVEADLVFRDEHPVDEAHGRSRAGIDRGGAGHPGPRRAVDRRRAADEGSTR